MQKRPLSVTVIGIFVLVQAAINLMALSAARSDPALLTQMLPPGTAPEAITQAIPIAMFACFVVALIGFGLLRGLNWARIAVVALTIFAVLMGVMQGNPAFLLSAALQAVMAFLLYRPAANAYFARKRGGSGSRSPSVDSDRDGNPPANGSSSGTFVA